MGYLDVDDAWLIALTRRRRTERLERSLRAHEALSFPFVPHNTQQEVEAAWREREAFRRVPAHIAWKCQQWEAGVRRCGYCAVRMTRAPNVPRTCTVDHRKPRAFGGQDVPENWIMACLDCNTRKGTMSEARFREQLAFWARIGERLTA